MSSLSSSLDSDVELDYVNPPRVIRDRTNLFDALSQSEFKDKFRLSKQTVRHLYDLIGENIEPQTGRNKSISGMQQILITLRFYATGAFQQVVGDALGGIHKSTICRVIRRVTHYIAHLRRQYIQMPNTAAQRQATKFNFFMLNGFPGVIGAIDCTHIKILSPGGQHAELFRNRKGFFSINTQMVCDASLKIMNVIARWPGSVHDSTIFNDSALCALLEEGHFASDYLIGDKGYACKSYLLTPFLNPNTPSEVAYNHAHAATRNVVERCFGVLKRRFPVLSLGIRLKMNTTVAVIVACAVLHNIAVEQHEEIDDNIIDLDEVPVDNVARNENTAVRRAVVNNYFARYI